ncbi:MAG: hypothetical protein WC584_03375 [Candidatus Pacearchaeota archaeon]
MMIEKDNGYWKRTLSGKIDEVRYYNRALNSTEIQNIYSGTM